MPHPQQQQQLVNSHQVFVRTPNGIQVQHMAAAEYSGQQLQQQRPQHQHIQVKQRQTLKPFLFYLSANSVCLAHYLTNHLTFGSETLHIYSLPQCLCFFFEK